MWDIIPDIYVLSNLILRERRTYQTSGRQTVTLGGMMSELFNMIRMKLVTYADIARIRYTSFLMSRKRQFKFKTHRMTFPLKLIRFYLNEYNRCSVSVHRCFWCDRYLLAANTYSHCYMRRMKMVEKHGLVSRILANKLNADWTESDIGIEWRCKWNCSSFHAYVLQTCVPFRLETFNIPLFWCCKLTVAAHANSVQLPNKMSHHMGRPPYSKSAKCHCTELNVIHAKLRRVCIYDRFN